MPWNEVGLQEEKVVISDYQALDYQETFLVPSRKRQEVDIYFITVRLLPCLVLLS